MYFLFFNFQDFILCVELIILQSSFIIIQKKMPKYFLKIMKEAKVFGFLWKIFYEDLWIHFTCFGRPNYVHNGYPIHVTNLRRKM
jgi:hypothetical protein